MNIGYKLKPQEIFIGPARIILVERVCVNCQKTWRRIPAYAIENEMGIWWNCSCRTTMFLNRSGQAQFEASCSSAK